MFILGEDEGVILKANEAFNDVDEKEVHVNFFFLVFYANLLFFQLLFRM